MKKIFHPWRVGWYFPHIGQRLVRTSIAVFICMMIYALRGYTGQDMPTEAAITAVLCVQPDLHGSKDSAAQRVAGSLIGVFWGLAFLLLMLVVPGIGSRRILLYTIMTVGFLISMYSAVAIRKPDTAALAGIVFLCVVIAWPDIEDPLNQAFHRIIDVLVGTTVAIVVNIIRLPRVMHRERLIFVRTRDLVPDQLSEIPGAVLYRLNRLYEDGARISMISEHAPAFMLSRIKDLQVNTPMIVMDGAAVYDDRNNRYLTSVNIRREASGWLSDLLSQSRISYFVYTIHGNRTRVFHHGDYSVAEKVVLERMRKSLYRDYMDEDRYLASEIVYMKAILPEEEAHALENRLREPMKEHGLRCSVRKQAGVPGHCGIYFYDQEATVSRAEEFLLERCRKEGKYLTPVEVFSPENAYSERGAARLLTRLVNCYEPLKIKDQIL